jgi:homotetrameric cytidine deaminase
LPPSTKALLAAAAEARRQAWAPYSGFAVGAAVLASGRVFIGCNVENSAYPLSVCAERNAIAAAVVAGCTRIEAVAIVGGATSPSAPCGGCRQVLAEFCAPTAKVVYAAANGTSLTTTVGALLPASFGAADLEEAKGLKEPAESTGSSRGPPGKRRTAPRRRGTRSSGRSRSR